MKANSNQQYHAHIYFDRDTLSHARALCHQAGELFGLQVGRMHEKPVGPHPCWSCQISFDASVLGALASWLDNHRQGLSVLIHGLSGSHLEQHTVHASWLGEPLALNLSMFET